MYTGWLLKCLGVFFCGLARINNKNPTILTKRPPVATTVPSGTQRYHWALVYRVYLRIFDPGPSNPTTFLGLCSPGCYRQSIESPMGVSTFNSTEKVLTFTIYDCILRIRPKKVCYSPFGRRISLACAICWMRCAGIPAYDVQRAKWKSNHFLILEETVHCAFRILENCFEKLILNLFWLHMLKIIEYYSKLISQRIETQIELISQQIGM